MSTSGKPRPGQSYGQAPPRRVATSSVGVPLGTIGTVRAMSYEDVRYEVADGVATVTLNRPERLNSWTRRLGAELGDAMATADDDDDVRAVVVTGAGRAFCAGADLSGGGFGNTDAGSTSSLRERWPNEVRKPVIAAINGHAVGVGITYPLMCDLRYVAEDAKLAFAFVRRGALPELASHNILPRVTGFAVAADLLLTGRTFLGREAAELGLVSKALPADEVLPAAMATARDIAANTAPVSVAMAKQLMWAAMSQSVDQTRAAEDQLFGKVTSLPDAREGVAAFVEKRTPNWTGRVSTDIPT